MSHATLTLERAPFARKFLFCAGAAILALLSGCATVKLTNLTPATLPENPSEIYTFSLRVATAENAPKLYIEPHVIVDGQDFQMKPGSLGQGMYSFDYQVPPGRQDVAYYFLVHYRPADDSSAQLSEAYTSVAHAKIASRYVLSLEVNRGPVGASVGVLGRGFTPQDVVAFDGAPARTVYASETALTFFVPPMPAGKNYQVSVSGAAGNSPVGTFRIDPTTVTASPASLTLSQGGRQDLTFTISNPAPAGGLLIDVTTDVPESIIMPEVVVAQGATSVTVSVEGGRPGSGNLVLKGYGTDLAIPITVSGR